MQVVVGRVVRPHGVAGEVVVEPRTDRPHQRFAPGTVLRRADGTPMTVRSARPHARRWLVRLAGVTDRDAADGLRDAVLMAESAEVAPDEADEFPDVALVGLAVQDRERAPIGVVRDVEHSSWQDLLVVTTPDDRTVRVPFVRDIVPTVDLAARVVVVDAPDGLLDDDDRGVGRE